MMTYRILDSIRQIAMKGEFNEFDLNVFFSAKGTDARFVYENEVQEVAGSDSGCLSGNLGG